MANTLIFLLQLLNRVESLVQTEDEQAAGVNGNWEAKVEAALVDVGAVGAAQVRLSSPAERACQRLHFCYAHGNCKIIRR